MKIRVCSYLEAHGLVDQSGIGIAVRNTEKALVESGVAVTHDPRDAYDVLHLHWVGPRSYGFACRARRRGRPVVLSVYTPPELVRGSFNLDGTLARVYGPYLRLFAHQVDLFVVPSPYAAAAISSVADGWPVRVVSSGVDLDRFRFDPRKREAFRKTYALDGPTVLAVGQVIPRKGVETFLEVARRLPDLHFLWLGPKVHPLLFYSPRFERLLRHRPGNVRFAGFVEGIEAAYNGCDLFFHPSHAESLGLVILEAAAIGLPLVVRRLPVYQGWLKEKENCLMGNDSDELTAAVARLWETRSPLPDGLARAHALDRVSRDLLHAYNEVLA